MRIACYFLLGFAALAIGCGTDADRTRDSAGSSSDISQALQPNLARNFLPCSLAQVIGDSGFSLIESHGIKGGGHFWSFNCADQRTGIDVEGVDNSHLTKITFFVAHPVLPGNVSADLRVIQAHVRRILAEESWASENGLGLFDDVPSLPAKRVHGKLELELLYDHVDTVLVISAATSP